MSARPGRILKIIDIPFPRPRSLRVRALPEFVEKVESIRELLGLLEENDGTGAPSPQAP